MADEDRRNIWVRLPEYFTLVDLIRFLFVKHPLLNMEYPIALIIGGDSHRVHTMLDGLDAGVYV